MATNRHFVPVEIDSTWLLIEASSVREFLGAEPWLAIPRAREELPGVMAWRGRALPIVDLGRVLGLGSSAENRRSRTVVVQHERGMAAIPVDSAREVRSFAAASVREVHNVKHPYATGEVDADGRVMAVIDVRALLSDLDRNSRAEGNGAA